MFVIQSKLPDTMPSLFSATYTPIAAAGTQGQIRHVARLLATQLNAAGLGPGVEIVKKKGVTVVSLSLIHICIYLRYVIISLVYLVP